MKNFSTVLFLFSTVFMAAAQTGTNTVAPRTMALQDCIQEALQHNLDVQIERYQPQISLYNLHAAYGGYDPLLNISGQHSYNVSPSALNPYSTNTIPASVSKSDSFKSDIGGTLPWGLQYDFSGNIADRVTTYPPLSGYEDTAGSIGVTLTQPLLKNFWIDNTRLIIKVAKNRLKYSEQGLRQQVITSVTAVENRLL